MSFSAANVNGQPVVPAFLSWVDDAGNPQQFVCFVKSEDYDFGADVTDHPIENGSNITDNVRVKNDEASVFFIETDSPVDSNNWATMSLGVQTITAPSVPGANPAPQVLPVTFTSWNNLITERALIAAAGGTIGGFAGPTGGAIGAIAGAVLGDALLGSGVPVELPFPPGLAPPPQDIAVQPASYDVSAMVLTPNADIGIIGSGGVSLSATAYTAQTIQLLRQLLTTAQVVNLIAPYLEIDSMVIQKIHVHRDKDTGRAAEIEVGLKQVRFVSTIDVPAPAPTIPRAKPPVHKGEQGSKDTPGAPASLLVGIAKSPAGQAGIKALDSFFGIDLASYLPPAAPAP